MSGPETIWIEDEFGEGHEDQWQYGSWDCRNAYDYVHEYTRADVANARIAAAYEAAAEILSVWLKTYSEEAHNFFVQSGHDAFADRLKPLFDLAVDECSRTIRALTPADAKAALEAVRREARNDALREASESCDTFDGPVSDRDFVTGQSTAAQQIRSAIRALIDKETTE